MESFESRFARLTPEQQKEVEDFADFLLLKNTLRQAPVVAQPPPVILNTPPVMAPDPVSLPRVNGSSPVFGNSVESSAPVTPCDTDSTTIHEITVGDDDWISRDYMDYGKFEPQTSPATEAVRKVKQKIIAREEQDKNNHLLDWVD